MRESNAWDRPAGRTERPSYTVHTWRGSTGRQWYHCTYCWQKSKCRPSLRPLGPEGAAGQPVAELSNADLLAAADAQMDATEDRRFSELLDKQQAGFITDADRVSLLALIQIYQDGLLRKAKALNEAVRRGLRPPLEP